MNNIEFQEKELIVLKPEFDDTNYKRVYEIVEVNSRGKLFVKAISEISSDIGKFPEKSDNSKLNVIQGPFNKLIFEKYL